MDGPGNVAHPDASAGDPPQCPLCEYDLRGLTEARCPECGYAFDWADLRDPARRKHKYLFEHHPERNLWSFLSTMLGGLRPRTFWGGLLPSQPSRPRRLMLYAVLTAVSTLLPPAALTGQMMQTQWEEMAAERRRWTATMSVPTRGTAFQRAMQRQMPGATTQQIVDRYAPAPSVARVLEAGARMPLFQQTLASHAAVLLWPGLSLAALMIFQMSMRRARVRPSHFARCVVYGADVIVWVNLSLALLVAGVTLRRTLVGAARQLPVSLSDFRTAMACAFAAALLVFIYRLIVALKAYVRFDHPVATILSTQFIVLLVVLLVVTWSMPF